MTHNPFTPAQNAYRFQADGTEAGATLLGSLNTALPRSITGDDNLCVRVRIQETGNDASGAAADDWQLQYQRNALGWNNVTAASAVVRAFDSGSLAEDEVTTNRLGAGSGSFVAGKVSEKGLVDNHQLTAANYTEYLYTIRLLYNDLTTGDAITFRLLYNGATFTYNQTPRIDVTKIAGAGSASILRRDRPAVNTLLRM